MDKKKKMILEMVLDYFDNNRFKYISIDEIVKFCKISKGTFYKTFGAKEDFICELILFSSNEMINTIRDITQEKELDSKERFKLKIINIEKYLFFQTRYMTYIIEKLSHDERVPIIRIRQKYFESLYDEYYIALIEFYGEDIKNQIWNLIFVLNGYIGEFIQLKRLRKISIDEDFMFNSILDALEIMKNGHNNTSSFISRSIFYNEEIDNKSKDVNVKESFLNILNSIEKAIEDYDMINSKTKLLLATGKIKSEIEENIYDSYILDAMSALLEKEPLLKKDVYSLNEIKKAMSKEVINNESN